MYSFNQLALLILECAHYGATTTHTVITVELGTNLLVFQRTLIRCTTISATDNNISEGSRSSHIVIGEGIPESTVPIEVYPSRIPLIILDDDGK